MGTVGATGTKDQRKRKLARTAHHMTGQTALGKVPGHMVLRKTEPSASYEYDPFEAGDFVQGWVGGIVGEQLGPVVNNISVRAFPDDRYPWLGHKYGKSVRTSATIVATNTLADVLAGPIANLVRATLHGRRPDLVGEPRPGLGMSVPPANVLAASLVKTFATRAAKTWLTTSFAPPPPPPPQPSQSHDAKASIAQAQSGPPGGAPQSATAPAPSADAKQGPTLLGKDLGAIAHESALYGVGYIISKVYDQTVGPFVQRKINQLMGKGDEGMPKPSPITPGGLISAVASSFVSSLLLRPVSWAAPAAPTGGPSTAAAGAAAATGPGFGGILATAAMNGLITSAFDSVWSRSVGPALANAVNSAAGLSAAERQPETYPMERLLRTAARSAASGAVYYLVDGATQSLFGQLGVQLGGGLGALVAMAGPALLGMAAGTVLDSVAGNAIGSLGGSVYEWLSGKPKAENRPAPQPAPVTSAEGDKAAQAQTMPMRRRRQLTPAQLAAIAAQAA